MGDEIAHRHASTGFDLVRHAQHAASRLGVDLGFDHLTSGGNVLRELVVE
jgi:hypothetical protein